MERLTEKHYKASDGYYMECSGICHEDSCDSCDLFAEFIDRMGQIEDILGDTYDLDRLQELVKADRDGRIKIIPEYVGKACGSCGHFQRIAGTRRGTCEVKRCATSRRGTPWPDFPFEPSQSRTACKQWIGKGEKNEE